MEIYYEVKGSQEPLILLHGNDENHHLFDRLVDDFQDDYMCIAIDSRYHGKSVKSGELSLAQMAGDVMAVADELNLDHYRVIGFSDGANIALTLAQKDPRLQAMVLLSPNSKPSGIKTFYLFMMGLMLVCLIPFCLYQKRARIKWKLTYFMLKEPHFQAADLQKIQVRTLLLSGDHDMIKKSDLDFIASSLRNCTHVVIKQCSHFLLDDQYGKVSKLMRGFLHD